MKTHRAPLLLAALATSLGLLSASPDAAAWTPLEGPPYPVWGILPVKYYINESTFPPEIASTAKQRLIDGYASWATPDCTDFTTQLVGNLPDGTWNANDGKNVLMWINKPDPWPPELGPVDSVIGVTLPVWSGDGMGNQILSDADIVFNNVGFCWYDSATGGSCAGGSPVDTLSIATHEQGHFLGLGHTDAAGATMQAFYDGGNAIATIEQDDADGVCALYPPGSGIPTCGACTTNAAKNECNAKAVACTGACIGLYNCEASCPTSTAAAYDSCISACKTQYPDGVPAFEAYAGCICTSCASSCPIECAGVATTGSGGNGEASGAWNSDEDEGPIIEDEGGCGCAVRGAEGRVGALAALGLGIAVVVRRRRRR